MAVEKTPPVQSPFQPRLRPRPVAVTPFSSSLDAAVSGSAAQELPQSLPRRLPGSAQPAAQAAPQAAQGQEVRGVIGSHIVRTTIDPALLATAAPTTTAASDQFSAEDDAALAAWSQAVKTAAKARQTARAPVKEPTPRQNAQEEPAAPAQGTSSANPDALAGTASALLGKRYAPGGESPRQGFDCSGLTSYVYAQGGVELPRSSREQYRQGTPVKQDELRKGDLVFFGKKGVHHVGIYLEDGKFIHSASSGKSVRVSSLEEPVWKSQYAGARRVL